MKLIDFLKSEEKAINTRLNRIEKSISFSDPLPVVEMPGFSEVEVTLTTASQKVGGTIYFDVVAEEEIGSKQQGRIRQSLTDMEKLLRNLPVAPPEYQNIANRTCKPVVYVHGDANSSAIFVWPEPDERRN